MDNWITSLIGGGASKIVDSVFNGVAKFVTTPEQKSALEMLRAQAELDVKKMVFGAETERLKDVQSAREMYMKDNSLQKIFALSFLAGYVALTGFFLYMLFTKVTTGVFVLPDWGVALVSAIWGQISAKVSTIVDFLFGSSKGSHDKDDTVARAIESSK